MSRYQDMLQLLPTQSTNIQYDHFLDLFPELLPLKTTPQDAYYHAEGDVWTHTKMVCDALLQSINYQKANDDEKFVLFYSCLFHDIAKPLCTRYEEKGRITSKGHSGKGCIDTRILLWKENVPFEIRENICNIINHHQVPFFVFNHSFKEPTYLVHELSLQAPLHLLMTVAKADMQGRFFVEKQKSLDDIELAMELALEENCFYNPKTFPDSITKMKYFQSEGKIDPRFPFYDHTKSKVIVLSGLPASGKNTWVSQNNQENLPILSFDDAKAQLGLQENDNVGKAVHMVIDQAKDLLRNEKNFIWNATHLSRQMRQKTIDLLLNYKAEVHLIYLEAPEEEIKKRNSQRDTTLTNKKIDEMLLKWEVPTSLESHYISYHIQKKNQKQLKM